jgi:GT2 family glycosyltransferase
MQPDFTIIVVNWNGESLLRDCLRSIRDLSTGISVQAILVDNASRDNSLAMARREFPEVELVCADRNLGFGAANNLALRQARGEFVLFLNPDARLLPGTLQALCEQLRKNADIGAVGCRMLDEQGQTQPLMNQSFPSPFGEFVRMFQAAARLLARFGCAPATKDPETSGPVVKISGGCLAARRTVLESLSGFDERFFMYCEDGDLCHRMILSGWKLYYLADAAVTHAQGSCSRQAQRGFSTLMQQESFHKYMAKYYGPGGARRYRVLMCVGSLARIAVSTAMLVATSVVRRHDAGTWRKRMEKNGLIFGWAVHAKKPVIPN